MAKFLNYFIILVVVVGLYAFSNPIDKNSDILDSQPANLLSDKDKIVKWQQIIEDKGPALAYRQFVQEYTPLPFNYQHGTAHIMGELLYKNAGLNGLAICDSSFAFGCYHSFSLKAIGNEGLSIVKKLDHACFEKYGDKGSGCTHGIGHGILEYLGHKNILKALEACELTTQPNPLFGCTSGVFMEYNIPTLISEKEIKTSIREPDYDNLYGPCNTIVPGKFRASCYFELVEWWLRSFNDDFHKVSNLCSNIVERDYREACFLNMGNMSASVSNYEISSIKELCSIPLLAEEKDWCLKSAANRLLQVPREKEKAQELL